MRFQDPYLLLFLLVVPALVLRYVMQRRKLVGTIRFSSLGRVTPIEPSLTVRLRHLPFVLRMVAVVLLVVALARPQSGQEVEEVMTEGIDIMLTLDISGSMLAEDFKPSNRLDVSKHVIEGFIGGRKNDRIGLVLFAGKALTQCPLTLDYGVLDSFVDRAEVGMLADGTAVGNALATAVQRIKDSPGKSKVIVMLTDGENNAGEITPQTAADVAKTFGIKVYTIGAGKKGTALIPVDDPFFGRQYVRARTQIDEKTLGMIADTTGGRYFRATDSESLETIFKQIDAMEKTEIEVKRYTQYTDLFWWLIGPALALVAIEIVLAGTRFRRIS